MQLSLEHLRELGYDPWPVERDIPARPKPIKRDFFHLADIEGIAPDHTLYVQATSDRELQDHLEKAMHQILPRLKGDTSLPRFALKVLIADPARVFEIWAWGQRAKGKRWTVQRMRAVHSGHRCGFVGVGGPAAVPETPMGPGKVQTSTLGSRQ